MTKTMPILLVVLIGLFGGFAIGIQSPLASDITQRVGAMESVFVVHVSGMVLSGIVLLGAVLFTDTNQIVDMSKLPWYGYISGLAGLIIIVVVGITIPRIGATGTIAILVAGQLTVSLIVDQFGLLGASVRPVEPARILGVLILAFGVWLVIR